MPDRPDPSDQPDLSHRPYLSHRPGPLLAHRPPPTRANRGYSRTATWLKGAALFTGLGVVLNLWHYYSVEHLPGQQVVTAAAMPSQLLAEAAAFPTITGSIPVLTYHDVSTTTSRYAVTPERFAEHLDALAAAGFQTVPLQSVVDLAAGKKVTLPPKPLLITFDDGFAGTYLAADPVLAKHHFTAVAFVLTGALHQGYQVGPTLNEAEISQMSASGRWQFGSHTDNLHALVEVAPTVKGSVLINRLPQADGSLETFAEWRARVDADLAASQQRITALTGRPAVAFAYPYGYADKESNDPAIPAALDTLLTAHGLRAAFVSSDLVGGPEDRQPLGVEAGQDRWHLQRLGVTGELTASQLLAMIGTTVPQPLQVRLTGSQWFSESTGTGTGTDTASSACGSPVAGSLTLPAANYTLCLARVHTTLWRDYRLSVTVDRADRSTALVAVRELHTATERSRVELLVHGKRLIVRDYRDGARRSLATVTLTRAVKATMKLDVVVAGPTMTVRIDGRQVASVAVKDHPTGGVAFGAVNPAGSRGITYRSASLTT